MKMMIRLKISSRNCLVYVNSWISFQIASSYLKSYKSFRKEWQLYLRRISDILLYGEGTWWSINEGGIAFYDSKDEVESHQEGPPYTTINHGL